MIEVVTFRVGATTLALPQGDVLHVLPAARTTRVPHAQGPCEALVIHRGRAVPVLVVGKRLGLEGSLGGPLLIVSYRGEPVALAVDAVEGPATWEPGSDVTMVELEGWLESEPVQRSQVC